MDSVKDLRNIVPQGISIEEESFKIIESEVGSHRFDENQWPIVRRVIHATGDFDFANLMDFHPRAVQEGVEALEKGVPIFVDTRMIAAGLSPYRLEKVGSRVVVPVSDYKTYELAKEWGITRSAAAFRVYGNKLNGSIVVIGNAPTALVEVIRIIEEGEAWPALVVGVPVGFVQAAESKELLRSISNPPWITVKGRKGGSPVAVSIIHALIDIALR